MAACYSTVLYIVRIRILLRFWRSFFSSSSHYKVVFLHKFYANVFVCLVPSPAILLPLLIVLLFLCGLDWASFTALYAVQYTIALIKELFTFHYTVLYAVQYKIVFNKGVYTLDYMLYSTQLSLVKKYTLYTVQHYMLYSTQLFSIKKHTIYTICCTVHNYPQ